MTPRPPRPAAIRPLIALALPLALLACSRDPGFVGVAGVREAEATAVAACAYVTDIRMTPGVYGPLLAQQGLSYARNRVKEDALAAGANTVVFEKVSPGEPVYEVRARAYRC